MEKCCQKQREDFAKEILDSMDSIEDENVQDVLKPVKSFIRTVRDRVSPKKLPSEEIREIILSKIKSKAQYLTPNISIFEESLCDWLDKNFPNGVER